MYILVWGLSACSIAYVQGHHSTLKFTHKIKIW